MLSLVATPFFLFVGAASAGMGHGNYFFTKILFPFTMLSTVFWGSITNPFITLAVLQYPFYGLLVGIVNAKRKGRSFGLALAIFHVSAVVVCFLLVGENFS
jgi:hypothetical protein